MSISLVVNGIAYTRDDQRLPLRHLSAHPGGHSLGGRAAGVRGEDRR